MKKTKWLVIGTFILVLFIFTGCDGNNENNEGEGDEITISLWNNNDAGRTYYPKLIEQFESDNPGIKIELTNLTADTEDAVVQTAISDNSLPDLFNQNAYEIDELVDLDLVKELDELFPENEHDQYVDGIFDEGNASYKGNIYLFPKYKGNVYAMYYNKNLVEEYGIEDIPETWDDLEEVGEKIYNESGGSSYGLIFGGESDWLLSAIANVMATELSPEAGQDFTNGQYSYANEGYVETIKFFKDLLDNNLASPTSLEVINEVALEYFANDEAAFLIDGNWTGQLLHDFGFDDWGVMELPTKNPDGQHYGSLAIGSNDGLYVSKDTENWEEVKLFLEYLKDNLYNEMVELGTAVVAKDVSTLGDVEPPFDQLEDISDIFSKTNVTVPDPLIINSKTNEVDLETMKNLPDTSMGLIFSGYLTGQIDDLQAELQKYDDGYNKAFNDALESTEGVSIEDYQFPNWTPYEHYTSEDYDDLK